MSGGLTESVAQVSPDGDHEEEHEGRGAERTQDLELLQVHLCRDHHTRIIIMIIIIIIIIFIIITKTKLVCSYHHHHHHHHHPRHLRSVMYSVAHVAMVLKIRPSIHSAPIPAKRLRHSVCSTVTIGIFSTLWQSSAADTTATSSSPSSSSPAPAPAPALLYP
jgi:hypothetical protein